MKPNYKKTLKLIALLITSVLISYVSAQTYSELFMYATPVSIGTAKVTFENGTDTVTMGGADAINTPQTAVTFDSIPAIEPGETRTYDQAVNITNGAGSTKTLNMSLHSLTGSFTANFDYINVTIIAANDTSLGNNIEIVSGSGTNVTSTGNIPMLDGETWTVRWIIKAKTGATETESISITFKVKVED